MLKISAPGGRDRVSCVPISQGGLEASTRYQVILESAGAGEYAKSGMHVNLVALWPSQGRTHQLRVHCAEKLGGGAGEDGNGRHGDPCYIIGDSKYGPNRRAVSHLESTPEDAEDDAQGQAELQVQDKDRVEAFGNTSVNSLDSQSRASAIRSLAKTRLCLHALRIKIRLPREGVQTEAGEGVELALAKRRGWKEVSCVAQVPPHLLETAEKFGISRQAFHTALRPFMTQADVNVSPHSGGHHR